MSEQEVEQRDQPELAEEVKGEEDVAAYVGNKTDVYLKKWNRGSMWNWSAFFMGIYWMLYRKMYAFTILVLVGFILLTTVIYQAMIALDVPIQNYPLEFAIVLYAILKLSIAVVGDVLYQVHVSRKLAKLSKEALGLSIWELAKMGGTHAVLPGVLLSLQLVAYATVLIEKDDLTFKAQSDEEESSAYAVRKGSLGDMALAITGYNWEDTVGYDRLVDFSRWILEEWREQGADLEMLGDDRTAEAELWAQMALEYFEEPENRDKTLIDAMKWVADLWPSLMASRSNENEQQSESVKATSNVDSQEDQQGMSIDRKLIEAVIYNEGTQVKQLLKEGANPDARDDYGQTAVMISGSDNRPGIMKQLLDAHADPALSTEDGGNALLYAVSDSLNINGEVNKTEDDAVAMVRMLLQAGIDPDSHYTSGLLKGQTALMEASRSYPLAAQLLLEAGADPNEKDQNGDTALKYAIDSPKLFERLLENGADPKIINKQGKTIRDEIIRQNATDIAELLNIPLENQLVTPADDEVEALFLKLRAGISQERAEELFGKQTSQGMEEENGTEIWEYQFPGKEGYRFTPKTFGETDTAGLRDGSMNMQLFIYWNGIGGVWYYEVYSEGKDNALNRYVFLPGDKKVMAN